ncbi:MAG TPA: twin-arginine translocase TatA/TatE family subunit [Bacteroidales bacterium]|nr:twin-arginine translocase TatA/TatE family subunit [Bacteroidales bacterium]
MASILFLDISFGEIFIIVVAIFIIFGPQKIPEFARKFGKGLREVRKASNDIRREINMEVNQYKTDLDIDKMAMDAERTAKPAKPDPAPPVKDETGKNDKTSE